MSDSTAELALQLQGVTKFFGATRALHDARVAVRAGETHGLIGLNGSGKSTLVKILSGVIAPEPGASCLLWGHPVALPVHSPSRLGIAVVQQDLALNRNLTVAENVNIRGTLVPGRCAGTLLSRRREKAAAAAILSQLGWQLPLEQEVGKLTAAEQAMTSIVRALALAQRQGQRHCLLILDEPTAYLSAADSQRLFAAVGDLVKAGSSALLISHRLDDIRGICDRVTVLREGQVVAEGADARTSKQALTEMMTGKQVAVDTVPLTGNVAPGREAEALRVEAVRSHRLRDVSFRVGVGEIVGCTGLTGSGFEDLPYVLTGVLSHTGTVAVGGVTPRRGPAGAVAAGLGLVPEDRTGRALWPRGTIAENLSASPGAHGKRRWFVGKREESARATALLRAHQVVASGPHAPISSLSGGNQQKVVLGRALRPPSLQLLVLHEPTGGVDIDARSSLYKDVLDRAGEGLGVLVCSTDLEELADLCGRVLIFSQGRIVTELSGSQITVDRLAYECQGPQEGVWTQIRE